MNRLWYVRLYRWQRRKPVWLLLLLFYAFCLICSLITSPFVDTSYIDALPKKEVALIAIFFAPIIETFLCQLIPIELLQRICKSFLKKRYPIVVLLITALLFALGHKYNIGYIIAMFVPGVALALCYWLFKNRDDWRLAFGMTALLHFMMNLTAEILECFTTTP